MHEERARDVSYARKGKNDKDRACLFDLVEKEERVFSRIQASSVDI